MRGLVENLERMVYHDLLPQHRLSVFHGNGAIVCVLEMSHAIMDGASMDILLRDLGLAYEGSLERLPKPLFSPFVACLQKRSLETDIAFWTTHLAGLEPCHFPVLNDGANLSETDKELCTLRIDFPKAEALQGFCNSAGFTLPNAFHAAWALTLGYYTGTDDVCFGYLISGRDVAVDGSEDAVGPFINMATQRARLSSDGDNQLSLLGLLEAVQKEQLDCMPYAQASLAEVQHALNLPGGMALFDTCISYRRLQNTDKTEGSIVCEDLGAIYDPTEYPISLNIETDDQGRAAIDLNHWTDTVASSQAKHVAATFLQVLLNMVDHAETPISQLDMVHETSKNDIWTWNANMPATTADCVHHMVEKQVALRPQAQAIRAWDGDFSYEEMNCLANRLARHLADFGVGPETFVPVCFDKSAWTTISLLAVLKAGGVVMPLDATHPAAALEGKVSDVGAHVVVASERRAKLFKDMVPHVVAVGPELLAQLPKETAKDNNFQSLVGPENAAYIIFTSGSTGKPKGVVLCHQTLVSSALAHGSVLGLDPHTRLLQFSAHTFDLSITDMFSNLIHGGSVCVPSDADRLGDLPGAIDRLGVNFLTLTPTVAALLRPEQVPNIRAMALGGEALTREVLEVWGGVVPMHNLYGPSECSIFATGRLHVDKQGDVSNLGTSIGSVRWVVDPKDHNRLVPVGCAGELLIEGPILGRGYLNKPVETAKAFIEMPSWAPTDPYHAERGPRRMYKTGDLVRYNSDGSLIYLARKDTQVKLYGQRIELGEIEYHVHNNLPATTQSSVELVTTGRSMKALAVFICVSPETDEELRILAVDPDFRSLVQPIVGAVAAQVASYMVPRLFLPVSRMPLTSSGKLDRRQLRTMAEALADNIVEYRLGAEARCGRPPETPMENLLREMWAEVLNVSAESIFADDSFFIHGGDSVGAMRLAGAARRRGIFLTVANIFQSPKLSDMAKTATEGGEGLQAQDSPANTAVEDEPLPQPTGPFSLLKEKGGMSVQELQEHVASICRINIAAVEDVYSCTPLQAGLVAASQRQPGAYVAVNLYQLPAGIDVSRFKKAWREVVESQAILRTRVVFVENIGFLQVVVRGEIDWATAARADEVFAAGHRQLPPHDGGILSRYTLIGEHTNRPTFGWAAHHALYDGWSLPMLLGRVEERYRNSETSITPSPHYSRFVKYLSGLDAPASDAYWTKKLSGPGAVHFPQLPHPGYRVEAAVQVARPVRFTKPKRSSLTIASFLRSAWALAVSIYSSSDDIVFGEILNGRDVPVPGIEELIGPTLASVPRRVRIDRAMTVAQLLVDVQAQLNDVTAHQFTGLQRIKTLNAATAAACDFKNLLAIDMAGDAPEDGLWSNLTGGGTNQGKDFFNLPLNVTCTLESGNNNSAKEIRVCATFDPEVVPQWQVVRMLGQFETLLSRLSAPECQQAKVGEIDLLSPEDKAVLEKWNQTPGPLVERRVHDMICDEMARQGRDATAVVGWDATLSNGELDALSTALAGELLSRGVGANGSRFVPFCFEKSTFAVVAMLAVLKAGAAFVPLDPAHPVARLREIVGDCAASVVLCSPVHENLCAQVVKTVVPVDMAILKRLQATRETWTSEGALARFVYFAPELIEKTD
jgi:amino acid adenylation domain-containing protein